MSEGSQPQRHEKPDEKLERLKDAFSRAVLENDLLFIAITKELEAVRKKIEGSRASKEQALTDFRAEPYRPTSETKDNQPIGIRITQSLKFEDDEAGFTLGFGVYGYVQVVDVNLVKEEAAVSDKFMPQEGKDERNEAARVFWDAYMKFLDVASKEVGGPGEISLDPHSGTFELKEKLDRTMDQHEFELFMEEYNN